MKTDFGEFKVRFVPTDWKDEASGEWKTSISIENDEGDMGPLEGFRITLEPKSKLATNDLDTVIEMLNKNVLSLHWHRG